MPGKKYIALELGKTGNLLKRNYGCNPERQKLEEATGKNSWIIHYLANHQDKDIYQRDIESTFSIRRSTVSNMLKLMEKKGYIIRKSVTSDARLKKLVLTQKALDADRMLMEQLEENDRLLKRNISDEELDVFFRVLEKLRSNIELPVTKTEGG